MSGYFKQWRAALHKILTRHGAKVWAVMSWIQFKAEWYPGDELAPGQVDASQEEIAKDCHLTRQEVRRALRILESEGRITLNRQGRSTRITLVNWSRYQSPQGGRLAMRNDDAPPLWDGENGD